MKKQQGFLKNNWDLLGLLVIAILLIISKETNIAYILIFFLIITLFRTIFNKNLRKSIIRWVICSLLIGAFLLIFFAAMMMQGAWG